jgi:uncharacterized RDD family membrane protein YckC
MNMDESERTTFRLAGFWRRAAAICIDGFVCSAPFVTLGASDHAVGLAPPMLLVGLVYHVFFWSTFAATPGKFVLGLRLVDAASGERLCKKRAALRFVGYLFSSDATLGIGFLWMIRDRNKQCVHDKMARSIVTRAADERREECEEGHPSGDPLSTA